MTTRGAKYLYINNVFFVITKRERPRPTRRVEDVRVRVSAHPRPGQGGRRCSRSPRARRAGASSPRTSPRGRVLREPRREIPIHRLEVGHVGEEDGGLDDVAEVRPASLRISPMFFITCSVCASIVSPANFMSGVRPIWRERSVFPRLDRLREYGPSAAGDLSVATTSLPAARTVSARAGEAARRPHERQRAGARRREAPRAVRAADMWTVGRVAVACGPRARSRRFFIRRDVFSATGAFIFRTRGLRRRPLLRRRLRDVRLRFALRRTRRATRAGADGRPGPRAPLAPPVSPAMAAPPAAAPRAPPVGHEDSEFRHAAEGQGVQRVREGDAEQDGVEGGGRSRQEPPGRRRPSR